MNTKAIILYAFILIIGVLLIDFTQFDIKFQDYFYNFELSEWIIDRDNKTLKFIFYDGIKAIYIILVLSILLSLLFFRHTKIVESYKKGLIIVLLSCILVPLFVGFLKATTHIPCPKNIIHFNGEYARISILTLLFSGIDSSINIKCFPAGHASGGFALLSLFFLFKSKKNRIIAFISALLIGWIIGFYKMLIGDHFFSHTFVSMLLAWIIVLIIHKSINIFFAENYKQIQ